MSKVILIDCIDGKKYESWWTSTSFQKAGNRICHFYSEVGKLIHKKCLMLYRQPKMFTMLAEPTFNGEVTTKTIVKIKSWKESERRQDSMTVIVEPVDGLKACDLIEREREYLKRKGYEHG